MIVWQQRTTTRVTHNRLADLTERTGLAPGKPPTVLLQRILTRILH